MMKYHDVYSALRDHATFSSANNPLLDRFPRLERADLPAVRQLASPLMLGFQHLPLMLTADTR